MPTSMVTSRPMCSTPGKMKRAMAPTTRPIINIQIRCSKIVPLHWFTDGESTVKASGREHLTAPALRFEGVLHEFPAGTDRAHAQARRDSQPARRRIDLRLPLVPGVGVHRAQCALFLRMK